MSRGAVSRGVHRAISDPASGHLLHRAARRVGWGLGDQAVSSITNFLCAAVAAHLLSAEELGAFSLAFLTYAVALNCSRGLATDPLMVRLGGADHATWRRAVEGCTGVALVVGVVAGLVVASAGLALTGQTGAALVALGIVLPALLVQDSWRHAFFVAGRGHLALLDDLAWAVALLPALVVVGRAEERTGALFVLAWGGAAAVAALVGLRQATVVPHPGRALAWLRTHRDLGPRFMVEGMTGSLATQIRAFGIGIAVGLAGVGHLAAANMLLGLVMIVKLGISAVIVPELAAVAKQSPRRMLQACLALGLGLASTSALWGALLWIGLPLGLGDLLVGSVWEQARPLVPLAALGMLVGSFSVGAGSGLHALGAARRSLRAMLIGGTLFAVLSVVGAFLGGVQGALAGTVCASSISAVVWWRELRAAVGPRAAEDAPAFDAGRDMTGVH